MRVQGGVTTHGVAANLVNEMLGFSMIVACGMPNAPMARLADYCDGEFDFDEFKGRFIASLEAFLEVPFVPHDLELPAQEDWVGQETGWKSAEPS